MPAHLTLLYPFVAPYDLTSVTRRALGDVAARHAPFDYALRGMAEWPDTIYVAVEPAEPFVRLQRDLQAAFPAYPIYGRDTTFRFVPHVSITEGEAVDDPATRAASVGRGLPRRLHASAIEVIASWPDGRWRIVWRIRLGRRDRAVDRMPA